MKRRPLLLIALALLLPVALFFPLRAARSWQPRTLELAPATASASNAELWWSANGLMLTAYDLKNSRNTREISNWNGGRVAVRMWRANAAAPDRAGASVALIRSGWGYSGGDLQIWDINPARRRDVARQVAQARPYRDEIYGTPLVAMSPDGASVAWNNFGPNLIVLADAHSGRQRATFRWPAPDAKIRSRGQKARGLAFSPDGRELAVVSDDALIIVDARTGKLRRWWRKTGFPPITELRPVWSPDGQSIAVIYGHARSNSIPISRLRTPPVPTKTLYLRIVDARTGQTTRALWQTRASSERIGGAGLSFSPDGKQLAWGTFEGEAVMMNLASGAIERRLPAAKPDESCHVAFAPDGQTLAVATFDKLTLWRVN